ncbi:unnamed protein product [Brachionus calyciflorus]|uniref:mitogen-activated protein kinase kinase n=1 Tax=Brachionus calyciflorus TaxID=104777 RepID=A0A813S0A0_9BILA|nr:unnamed protein product [Brachionus calyciflorus]
MCFSFLNACSKKNPKLLDDSRPDQLDNILEDKNFQTDRDILKVKISIESKLNTFYQNLLDNTTCENLDNHHKHQDKLSLISSSSSTLSSFNSSITNLSIKMQSESNCKNLENISLTDCNDKPKILPKPKLFNMGIGLNSPSKNPSFLTNKNQPELKIEGLNTKKQSYVFNSAELVAKPISLRSEEEDKLTDMLDESEIHRQNDHNRDKKKPRPSHRDLKSKGGKLTFSKELSYEFNEKDIQELGQIGNGEFGTVSKVLHRPSGVMMAMKRVGPTVGNQGERKKVLKELCFVLECHDYEYVVKFYGVKFNNEPADCLICMEIMDASLEKFYKFVYDKKHQELPESFLGKVCVATLNALNYLKEKHRIIHRDVKPSNILINRQGDIKMCDFGISGKLVDSIAASRDAGCQLYMAPERIDPMKASRSYDVRSDVWSLGITLYEISTGKFPYPEWKSIFHQLSLVVEREAPKLESTRLSEDYKNFVNTCLTKDEQNRPKYNALLSHPLIVAHTNSNSKFEVAQYVEPYIIEMNS